MTLELNKPSGRTACPTSKHMAQIPDATKHRRYPAYFALQPWGWSANQWWAIVFTPDRFMLDEQNC
jgi:hypothetical protein